MKLQFKNVGRDRVSLEVEIQIDYRAAPDKFERALKKEPRQRDCKLPVSVPIDCMPTAEDGSEGIVFAGRARLGEWHRVGA